ncbi:hypothetical protein H9P43_002002 [Blastocladiella emersonii ATCC 22665]|nr:hypothetical protein H9P43_002002 [Blastocladiella emersonii ATCC 22665]
MGLVRSLKRKTLFLVKYVAFVLTWATFIEFFLHANIFSHLDRTPAQTSPAETCPAPPSAPPAPPPPALSPHAQKCTLPALFSAFTTSPDCTTYHFPTLRAHSKHAAALPDTYPDASPAAGERAAAAAIPRALNPHQWHLERFVAGYTSPGAAAPGLHHGRRGSWIPTDATSPVGGGNTVRVRHASVPTECVATASNGGGDWIVPREAALWPRGGSWWAGRARNRVFDAHGLCEEHGLELAHVVGQRDAAELAPFLVQCLGNLPAAERRVHVASWDGSAHGLDGLAAQLTGSGATAKVGWTLPNGTPAAPLCTRYRPSIRTLESPRALVIGVARPVASHAEADNLCRARGGVAVSAVPPHIQRETQTLVHTLEAEFKAPVRPVLAGPSEGKEATRPLGRRGIKLVPGRKVSTTTKAAAAGSVVVDKAKAQVVVCLKR